MIHFNLGILHRHRGIVQKRLLSIFNLARKTKAVAEVQRLFGNQATFFYEVNQGFLYTPSILLSNLS